MRLCGIYLLVGAAMLGATGCTRSTDRQSGPEKLTVAVSVAPQAWLVKQIGGDRIDVLTLVAPADNPHTYQPSDAQVSRVMQAAAYFRIGVPFESGPWFEAIESSRKVPIVDVRKDITLRQMESHSHHEEEDHHGHDHGHAHEHQHAGPDPHIWLSPPLLKTQAGTIADALSEIDPANRSGYDRNRAAVQQRLDDLDARIVELLEPLSNRAFFVFHPAWGYFADAYGLKQVAIEIEGKQPSDAELTEVQQEARRLGIQVIFVQPQITGQAAHAVAEAVGARVETLDPLAEDVAGNLLGAAEAIARSHQEKPSDNDG